METSYKAHIEQRVIDQGAYIVRHKTTIRETARAFGISKSTTHKDMQERLPKIDRVLHGLVSEVIEINKKEGTMRGGIATRKAYERLRA